MTMRLPLVLTTVLLLAGGALAARLPGGDDPATDCLAELELRESTREPVIECTDCDPSCDRDGVAGANGSCTFAVALCLNQSAPGCTPRALDRVRARPRTAFVVPPLDSSACGAFTDVVVKTRKRGSLPGRKRLRVTARSTPPRQRDRNMVRLVCQPRPAGEKCPVTEARDPCSDHDPLRRVFFGDLHVHTRNSFDANAFDVETTPEQAYRFALGEPLTLPGSHVLQIDRPLDFAAVTDHSEFLGEVEACTTPGSAAYDTATCQFYRGEPYPAVQAFGVRLVPPQPTRFPDVCAPNQYCLDQGDVVWTRVKGAAEAYYDRTASCGFTTFVAYEYTAATGISTLHRNVIFRNERVPYPTTYFEQPTPQGLWQELDATCLDSPAGCDVLAIPHNSNESNGKMFRVEYPGATTPADEAAQAAFRARMEPLVEVYQHKGDSECMNGLSGIMGAPDELCGFEKELREPFQDCGDGTGTGGSARLGCFSRLDFVRNVLLAGLRERERLGVNPYPLGFIGSTDTHNGTPGAVVEETFVGHRGTDDNTPALQLGHGVLTLGGISFSPGGLAAVWAEENSRSSLFDALRRRETYATSGPRMAVRFFGGWGLPPALCAAPDMVAQSYALGVPMGGTLAALPPGPAAPSFLVSALRDPGTVARPGTPLQRVQVVKGWVDAGELHYQVFEVAGDPDNGATVDDATCVTSGPGFDDLCTVWTDPAFDPAQHAFYYARVVENPTCRWSTYTCNALPPASRPPNCTDPAWPRTIQERAWTSPIWYEPAS